jgi:phage tail-like protein
VDVNGTRFRLIKGQDDWLRCTEEGQASGFANLRYNEQGGWLMLKDLPSLFPQRKGDVPLDPADRRGAAVDRYGNWYWISHDRQQIYWVPSGSGRPSVYWSQAGQTRHLAPGAFGPATPPQPLIVQLAGLAVTAHHYLIVGNVTQGGLFRFDLHAGGEPMLLLLPQGVPFEPFDMAPAPDGGIWILDRTNRTYWGLDRQFQVITDPAVSLSPPSSPSSQPPSFHPVGGAALAPPMAQPPPGFGVAAQDPIGIETLPDGSVLILDRYGTGPSSPPSTVYHYRLSRQVSPPLRLEADADVVTVSGETITHHLAVTAHDLAYTQSNTTLYLADYEGKQTIAFDVDFSAPAPSLNLKTDYLPMHFFGGRALVSRTDTVFYDVVGGAASRDPAVRWVQLQTIDEPYYARAARLLTPVFDGKTRDCVWDRLYLDACLPSGASVAVWSRASNDQITLNDTPFSPEPNLYLRGSGAEIPYYNPFPDLTPLPQDAGTWELLFQQAQGRYVQLRLDLSGNGRLTPQLRALRAYYPRFSYPKQYLPAVYQEDAQSASFLERLLSNPEGFYTDIEGKIRDVGVLFDARSAPREALDWLAGWVGLIVDPLWQSIQEIRAPAGTRSGQPVPDRRRLFIRYALRLYQQRGTPDGIRFALHLFLEPCLETTLQRFKDAAIAPQPGLRDELTRLGLPYPTPVMSETQLEDLLRLYVLSADRPSDVRLVERFLTRGGRGVVAGDPTSVVSGADDTFQATAHRFSVLIPQSLTADEEAMIRRIVTLEKPAHTDYDVRRFWEYFRIGEVRLGIDTVLGEDSRFVPMILGGNYLAEGYVAPAHPMNVPDRLILDRDRLGATPRHQGRRL